MIVMIIQESLCLMRRNTSGTSSSSKLKLLFHHIHQRLYENMFNLNYLHTPHSQCVLGEVYVDP